MERIVCRSGLAMKMELTLSPTGKEGGSWCFSFRETSVSMLTLWLGYFLHACPRAGLLSAVAYRSLRVLSFPRELHIGLW